MRTFLLLLLYLLFYWAPSQNLIPDSSFESNKALPLDFSAIGNSMSWSRPGMGTTDLFCKNDRRKKKYSVADVPQNAMGKQEAHSGTCYAGFFLYSHGDYREYLQSPLTHELEKGKTYRLSLYLSLADYSQTYIDQLGFCFLPEEVHYPTGDVLTSQEPVYIRLDAVGRNITNWYKISGIYKAKGGEKFILIGSFEVSKVRKTRFSFPKNMKTPINKTSQRDAYYYVDDVSLVEVQLPPEKEPIAADTIDKIPPGVPLALHVLFKTNRSAVLPESYPDLDIIVRYLKENPSCKLEIAGHTDNSGNEKENMLLSAKRAQSVAAYLERNGIAKEKISCEGFGDTKPIFPNDTEEHKKTNRRVEITFVK